jgi:hypothetical protein
MLVCSCTKNGGYILSIRSDVVEDAHTATQKKENLVRIVFYGSVLLIVQLQYSKQSVTMVIISHFATYLTRSSRN